MSDSTHSTVFKECKCWTWGGNKDFSTRIDELRPVFMSYEMNCGIVPFSVSIYGPILSSAVSVSVKILKIYNQFLRGAFSILFETCCVFRPTRT